MRSHAMQPSAVPYHHWRGAFLRGARNTSKPAAVTPPQPSWWFPSATGMRRYMYVWCACGVGVLAGACTPSMHPMHLVSGRGLCQPKRDIREPTATATPRPTARTWPPGSTGARGLACQLLVAARIWTWRVRWRPVGHEDRRLRADPGRTGWELNSSRPRLRRLCRACPLAAERNQTQTERTDTAAIPRDRDPQASEHSAQLPTAPRVYRTD